MLVTGASGFVGKHLIKTLLETEAVVTAIYHTKPLQDVTSESGGRITCVQADVTVDNLSKYMPGARTVYHLAGIFSPGSSDSTLQELCKVNVAGTVNVAHAAAASGVERFILVSSVAACEASDERLITEEKGAPVTSYGISKLRSEGALKKIAAGKMNYIILRPTALFGEDHLGSIYELARAIKRGRFILIGNGRNYVNFQYVQDFTDVLATVGSRAGIENEVYIAGDTPITLLQLVHCIRRELQLPLATFHIPKGLGLSLGFAFDLLAKVTHRPMPLSASRVRAMTRDVCYSSAKLRKQLPNDFRYGVRAGLARTLGWYESTGLL